MGRHWARFSIVFWTGTLTVFDKEIDQWMKPELRIAKPSSVSLDELVLPKLEEFNVAPGTEFWMSPPQARIPAVRLFYKDEEGKRHTPYLDPKTGDLLDLTDSHAGTEFFFDFHFMLHMPGNIGLFIVGLAAIGMMAMVISGIFIHRKFFQDFFTFRQEKNIRRSSLDFHNLTAVIGLPFHFLLPLSGLFIFASVYFPWPLGLAYEGKVEGFAAATSGYQQLAVQPAGKPGAPVTEVDALMLKAQQTWQANEGSGTSGADWVSIFNYGDENAYVIVERFFPSRRVAIGPHQVSFDPQSGDIINTFSPRPVHAAMNWLEGLHWIQFDHWLLRWLYFFAGLSGCAMIASGFVFWIQSRIRKGQTGPRSVRVVRAISVASTTGIIIASGIFLVANRLIPKEIALDGIHRHDLEIWAFFLAWLLTFIHAIVRGRSAWHEQSFIIALTAISAVALNWVTTGDNPVTAAANSIWSVAIMDLILLLGSAFAVWIAVRVVKARRANVLLTNET